MYLTYYILGIILIPAIILSIYAQAKVSSTYDKYSTEMSQTNLVGKDCAKQILKANDIIDVQVEEVEGKLTDYYDSKNKILALSKQNYNSSSIASLGVVAHECGHAIQDKENYFPNKLRSFVIKVYNISSKILMPIIIIGLLFDFLLLIPNVANIFLISGMVVFGLSFLLSLITLPVEFNASKRALKTLKDRNILNDEEVSKAKQVLSAAALTYVASFLYSLLNFLRFVLIFVKRNDN
ncbi:MAG: zinc metallopeptidase [Christensenellales bacterium]